VPCCAERKLCASPAGAVRGVVLLADCAAVRFRRLRAKIGREGLPRLAGVRVAPVAGPEQAGECGEISQGPGQRAPGAPYGRGGSAATLTLSSRVQYVGATGHTAGRLAIMSATPAYGSTTYGIADARRADLPTHPSLTTIAERHGLPVAAARRSAVRRAYPAIKQHARGAHMKLFGVAWCELPEDWGDGASAAQIARGSRPAHAETGRRVAPIAALADQSGGPV
jgi:hypothetical protein